MKSKNYLEILFFFFVFLTAGSYSTHENYFMCRISCYSNEKYFWPWFDPEINMHDIAFVSVKFGGKKI